jgi:two-component system LytT family sensor kinase
MKSRGLRKALLVWLAWTLFALFAASQNYLSRAYYTPIEWGPALRLALLDGYVWALLTPAVFWVVARIDPRRGNLRWSIPLAVVASLVFAAGHLALFMQVMPHLGFPVSRLARNAIPSTKLHSNILTCWALMGIQYYLARERRARELAARLEVAQLEALRMQLEPHFLFNTLHAISALMYRDVEGADRMITRLSDFLRLTLDSAGQQEVTLMREMEYLDKYLEIEQVRFGDRLEVRRSIAPGTLDLMVPNLALQPLVENAVRHGIAPRAEGGRIEVVARVDGGSLVVEVSDSGPGAAGAIREGLGISNTRARLEQLYGAAFRLELGNAPAGGFRARMRIPAHSEPVHASSDRR